jgi:outer membrane murein-binding lipoprotein Lpp
MKKSTPTNESNVFNDFTVLEINEDKKRIGRKNIKLSLHEVHQEKEKVNKNGLHYEKEFVNNALDTAMGIPLVVSYVDDDKTLIDGHGEQNSDENGNVYFENSEVIGVINKAYIETIEINGKSVDTVVGEGVIYEQRNHNLVKFVQEEMQKGNTIAGSVEFAVFSYLEDNPTQDYRTPKDYEYTAHSLLYLSQPADDASVLLELNQTQETNVLDINEVKENDSKERSNTMENLQVEVQAEETKIAELNTQIAVLNAKIVELNSTVETNNVSTEELNAKIANLESELNKYKEAELAQAREAMVAEFNSKLDKYSDSQKEVAKAKIETFTAEPSESLAQEIVNEINAKIVEELLNAPAKEEEIVETNSTEEELDIYSAVIDNKQEATDDVAIY